MQYVSERVSRVLEIWCGYQGRRRVAVHKTLPTKPEIAALLNIVYKVDKVLRRAEHLDRWPNALQELGAMTAAGTLKYRESVSEGLSSAPDAFLGLLKGRNFGKQLVRLA